MIDRTGGSMAEEKKDATKPAGKGRGGARLTTGTATYHSKKKGVQEVRGKDDRNRDWGYRQLPIGDRD